MKHAICVSLKIEYINFNYTIRKMHPFSQDVLRPLSRTCSTFGTHTGGVFNSFLNYEAQIYFGFNNQAFLFDGELETDYIFSIKVGESQVFALEFTYVYNCSADKISRIECSCEKKDLDASAIVDMIERFVNTRGELDDSAVKGLLSLIESKKKKSIKSAHS